MAAKNVTVVPASMFHVKHMAPRVRQADRDEMYAASLSTPEEALERGLERSTKAWAALFDGEVACIFGVAPGTSLSGVGYPWMLGTDLVDKHQVTFLRGCAKYVDDMAADFDSLVNYVDARNTKAIRWLKWLGFRIEEAKPAGILRMPFHRFEMRRAA